jgi:23S rRNA (adenine2503-C2)-methyltransferase
MTTPEPDAPVALLGHDRESLGRILAGHLDRPFRSEQIYRAMYEQGVSDLHGVTGLGKPLRANLAERFIVGHPQVDQRHQAADGTTKYLFRLADGATIEAVDIPERRRRTLCLSSQAGCALGCRFCVTGFWGAGRDLTAGEILGQVLAITGGLARQDGLNLVFMGMGEPLLNLAAVKTALGILTEWISWRRITVSTVGILPALEELAGWEKRPNLAISLHAPDDARRSEIMPVNRAYPLAELMDGLRRYPLEPGRRLTFEYLMIRGFNDAIDDADLLSTLLAGIRGKVNLIPLNPDRVLGERMAPPEPAAVEAFKQRLRQKGWVATVRQRRGDDVSAACGQLRAPGREPRGFRRSNLSW